VQIRCGSGGEVRVHWDQLQPHNVPHWAARPVHGHGGRERERVVGNGVVASAFGGIRGRFISGPLPHYCHCFSHLYPGNVHPPLSLSLSPTLMLHKKIGNSSANLSLNLNAGTMHVDSVGDASFSKPFF
jgi:hypothetical protein